MSDQPTVESSMQPICECCGADLASKNARYRTQDIEECSSCGARVSALNDLLLAGGFYKAAEYRVRSESIVKHLTRIIVICAVAVFIGIPAFYTVRSRIEERQRLEQASLAKLNQERIEKEAEAQREVELQAQRSRNGGLTDSEVERARQVAIETELAAQRSRNGGLTDSEVERARQVARETELAAQRALLEAKMQQQERARQQAKQQSEHYFARCSACGQIWRARTPSLKDAMSGDRGWLNPFDLMNDYCPASESTQHHLVFGDEFR